MDGWVDAWMMNGGMGGCVDSEWKDGWMDGWVDDGGMGG